jgi:hypothetical protein
MTNKWVAMFSDADPWDGVRLSRSEYWRVEKEGDRNYFIVEECGDETDGDRLAAMLNERDELIAKDARREKLLDEILSNMPEGDTPPSDPAEWKLWTVGKRIRQERERDKLHEQASS